jgi:PTS system beta-glucosides-specific IIC component
VYSTTYILYYSIYGNDPIALTSYLATHLTIGFTALYAGITAKDEATKEISLSSCITMLLGCISEPAIFGVLLRNKNLYKSQTVAAGITGIFVALFGITNYVIGSPASLLGLAGFFGPNYSPALVILLVPIAFVASFTMAKVFESGSKFLSKKKGEVAAA